MSELKTSPPNDSATKKALPAPRSTKTSRAREIYLQKQASLTPGASSTPTPAAVPKVVPPKPKTFKATPAPSYLVKKNPSKASSIKSTSESLNNKDVKNETKPMATPHTTQGDVADEDFEIVQLNEIKDSNNSAVNSPRLAIDAVKTSNIAAESQPTEQVTPRPLKSPQDQSKKTVNETETQVPQDKKFELLEPNNIVEVNPCDAVKQLHGTVIEDLESKLGEREKDIVKLEGTLREATNDLKRLEEEYSNRLNELTKKLNESEQRLEKSIDECNQHKYWVDNTENQLSTMKLKFLESEQRMLAQEEDLRRLLRWSNIKNASIVTCAATAIAYYHVKK